MTQLTIVGNLTDNPELRFTAQGKAVANFTVAVSKRVKDGNGNWTDGSPTYWRCSLWGKDAENMAESLVKGDRVIALGEASQRSFDTREGEKRTVIEVTATEVGPSLKWSVAKVDRTSSGAKQPRADKAKPESDPWGSDSAFNSTDEIPF